MFLDDNDKKELAQIRDDIDEYTNINACTIKELIERKNAIENMAFLVSLCRGDISSVEFCSLFRIF